MKFLLRIIYWASLLYLGITITAFSIGQIIPIEFTDIGYRNMFYDIGFYAIPVATCLTLTGTIKRNEETKRKLLKIWLTIFASGLSIVLLFAYILTIGFGAWTDLHVIFRSKTDEDVRIVEQLYDIGAFGYGGRRTVKTLPLTPWLHYVIKIDTTKLDKADWIMVNEEGKSQY